MRWRSNCLIFVVRRWLSRGGYVLVRKSQWGAWPHFLWSADLITFEEFTPQTPCAPHVIPPLLFVGRARVLRVKPRMPGRPAVLIEVN